MFLRFSPSRAAGTPPEGAGPICIHFWGRSHHFFKKIHQNPPLPRAPRRPGDGLFRAILGLAAQISAQKSVGSEKKELNFLTPKKIVKKSSNPAHFGSQKSFLDRFSPIFAHFGAPKASKTPAKASKSVFFGCFGPVFEPV